MDIIIGNSAISLWPFALALLPVALAVQRRRGRGWAALAALTLFWLYMMVMLDKVLFPWPLSNRLVHGLDPLMDWGDRANLNLIPFYINPRAYRSQMLEDAVLNVLMTMPFGFGLPLVARVRPGRMWWAALGLGLGLEGSQLLLSLAAGVLYRVVDVNDVMCNMFGALLGYTALRIVATLYAAVANLAPNTYPTSYLVAIASAHRIAKSEPAESAHDSC